jgi:hypothetical protein
MTRIFVLCLAFLALAAAPALAQPTTLVLRAQAHDAKFIGTSMGGVEMTLVDAATGKVLAKGITAGGTGDTATLIVKPKVRGAPLTTPETAGFTAVIDIAKPTLVRLEARGPLGKPGSLAKVSATRWVLPGQDLTGDGWIVEMPGLVVEPTFEAQPDGALRVSANVAMMCGCPVEPGGHWDANGFEVRASLLRKGDDPKTAIAFDLAYDGKPSRFAGLSGPVKPGRWILTVWALDKASGDVGVSSVAVKVP